MTPATVGARGFASMLGRYARPQWRRIAVLGVLLLAGMVLELAQPRILAEFIDRASRGSPMRDLTRLAALFIGIAAVTQAGVVARAYLGLKVATSATNRVRSDLTRHCLRLDLSFHQTHRPGELIQRIEGDVSQLSTFLSTMLVALAGNALMLAGVLVLLYRIDLRVGLALSAFAAASLAALYRIRTIVAPMWERAMQSQADQAGFLEEHLAATEDIRANGATADSMEGFLSHARELRSRLIRAGVVGSAVGSAGNGLFTIGKALALGLGGWLLLRRQITIGTVFLLYSYTELLSRPVGAITRNLQLLQSAAAAIVRVDDLFSATSSIVDGSTALLDGGALGVRLERVRFRYLREEPVLEGVTFDLAPGRVLGVVGRTGSGKTTLTRLLTRFVDADDGVVSLGGVDVRTVPLAHLRDRVGLVTQDVQLFHATVRDNLTFFDPSVRDEDVAGVLEELGLGDWYRTLPAGVDTMLAPGGTGLSAGEAQLLAFARVFLRDPGLVVLDEATSRIDAATEARVERAVDRLLAGRTGIVVAHRLATVARADEILVLEDGRVAEHGDRRALAGDPASTFSRLLRTGLLETPA